MDWKEPTGMSGKCRDINICQKDNFPIPSVSASWDTREHLWQWLSIYILWCKVQVTETQINNALLTESNQFIAAISHKSDNRASERLTNTQLCRFIDRDRKLYWSTLLVYSGRKDLHGDKKKKKQLELYLLQRGDVSTANLTSVKVINHWETISLFRQVLLQALHSDPSGWRFPVFWASSKEQWRVLDKNMILRVTRMSDCLLLDNILSKIIGRVPLYGCGIPPFDFSGTILATSLDLSIRLITVQI